MLEKFRQFLKTTGGMVVGVVLLIAAVIWAASSLRSSFGQSEAAGAANEQPFVDAETNQGFMHTPKFGDTIPVLAPSGKKSGYPAELCFWTKDGKDKSTPTHVLMNASVGKSGPTFCPDCGRLVTLFNARPGPNVKVPPTKEEFAASKSNPAQE